MNNKNQITNLVEIKQDIIKYVIGRGRENMTSLQTKYPSLRIFTVRGEKNGIVVEGNSVLQVDYCVKDINNYVMSAYAYLENSQKIKKINKEKLAKKKSIQAINKIKNTIRRDEEEKERMKIEIENAKKDGREVKSMKKQASEKVIQELFKKNYYYGLEIEE
tara:strand:+ start:402 stop:887 length:486 start_codon:yes stop_codon:yes gene_type:complete